MKLNSDLSSLNLNPKAVLLSLSRIRLLVITLLVIGLAGFTLYQISLITAISPDETTLNLEREQIDASRIKFDTATIQALTKQTQLPASADLSDVGKKDPFYQ